MKVAMIVFTKHGKHEFSEWLTNIPTMEFHRECGPAVIWYNTLNEIIVEHYYKNGKHIETFQYIRCKNPIIKYYGKLTSIPFSKIEYEFIKKNDLSKNKLLSLNQKFICNLL